jgi:hypothetical protein
MRTGVEVVIWDLVFTKQAQKDARKLASSNLRDRAQALLDVIQVNNGDRLRLSPSKNLTIVILSKKLLDIFPSLRPLRLCG